MSTFKKAAPMAAAIMGIFILASWKADISKKNLPAGNANVLLFRTHPGSVSVPAGQRILIGSVNVSNYSQIRVVSDEREGSGSTVTFDLTITEGNELVAQLDILNLNPNAQVTKVYDTPGTKLDIYAKASGGNGPANVDFLVYGSR
jgi:hypothetical protein